MKVDMKCDTCNKISSKLKGQSVWEYTSEPNLPTRQQLGDEDTLPNGLMYHNNKEKLILLGARPEHKGRYFCSNVKSEKELVSIHDVTVIEMGENTKFHTFFSTKRGEAYGEEKDGSYSSPVRSVWTSWSKCNRCGQLGERFRLGICTEFGDTFPQGKPCRSDFNSPSVQKEFEDRLDEKEVAECEAACPKGYQRPEKDKDHVAKLVDLHLPRPKLPRGVEQRVMYVPEREDVELKCPGGGITDAISWKNGSAMIHSSHLRTDHVFVDYMNVLHIRGATPQDATGYECFYGSEHVANVKLVVGLPLLVTEESKGKMKYIGFVFTGLIVILVVLTINKNRKLHKRLR
ncbi:Ig-like V-type domain-containing protein FAM187A [Asterias rubens]|uniref:Ig-like V-type domain-containing protein FAM187A n=1 Tax=Asterias rubens TaxID=7604 RepID=UPI001454F23E|nr:Ig-like V-type domain-containing protein FAM187A [Asterias rubens]